MVTVRDQRLAAPVAATERVRCDRVDPRREANAGTLERAENSNGNVRRFAIMIVARVTSATMFEYAMKTPPNITAMPM